MSGRTKGILLIALIPIAANVLYLGVFLLLLHLVGGVAGGYRPQGPVYLPSW